MLVKRFIKKFVPNFLLQFYHFSIAWLGAIIYRFPSNKMIVIGVTGTKGKTTTVFLISKILEEAGYKVGFTSGIKFKVDKKEWLNDLKMTMPGRFFIQKLLSQMAKAKCDYAIIETTSEGIKQFRHLGINYDIGVFTNLTPEHIESHGSFKKYRQAKEKLFKKISLARRKNIKNKKIKKINVINLDDKNAEYFLKYQVDKKIGYRIKNYESRTMKQELLKGIKIVKAKDLNLTRNYSSFMIRDLLFKIQLIGKFNVYNSLAAVAVGLSQNIDLKIIKKALEKVKTIPGRLEKISLGQPFKIIIDYAHEPASLEQVYKTLELFQPNKIISILGSQGGGRDKQKRPILGKLAAQYTDYIIVTNEDPYDENPRDIIKEVAGGAKRYLEKNNLEKKIYQILDRREAIKKALRLAQPNDLIIITGKGGERWMCLSEGKKIPWRDKEIVKEEIEKIFGSKYD